MKYYYSLDRMDDYDVIFSHDKEFTLDEFKDMCKEAPIKKIKRKKYYDIDAIAEHLINNYGFEEIFFNGTFNMYDKVDIDDKVK